MKKPLKEKKEWRYRKSQFKKDPPMLVNVVSATHFSIDAQLRRGFKILRGDQ